MPSEPRENEDRSGRLGKAGGDRLKDIGFIKAWRAKIEEYSERNHTLSKKANTF